MLGVALVSLTGCSTLEKGGWITPSAVTSKYFKTAVAGFDIHRGQPPEIRFMIDLEPLQPMPNGLFLEVQFENPLDPKNPFIVTKQVAPADERVFVRSPLVEGLRAAEGYGIKVLIYDSEKKGSLLGIHEQVVHSDIDQRLFKKKDEGLLGDVFL
jgi:hypothetical protein